MLSANIRYVYDLGNFCVTYNLMLITLAYVSSTVQWGTSGGPTNPVEFLNLWQDVKMVV
jgi:hypothetical protein